MEELNYIPNSFAGNQLMVNWVYVYDHKLNGNFSTIYPNLSIVAQMKQIQTVQRKTVLTSVENVQFTSFAKSSKFKKGTFFSLYKYRFAYDQLLSLRFRF